MTLLSTGRHVWHGVVVVVVEVEMGDESVRWVVWQDD
jgi:hypothetical protein